MPGFIDSIKSKVDALDKTYNPFRKVGDAMAAASTPPPDPTGGMEAKARGDATRNEAIARGKMITVDDRIKKIP